MAPKRVTDVSSDYEAPVTKPASNAEIARIRKNAHPVKTGKLERDVDAVLHAKGVSLDSSLADAVRDLGRQPFAKKAAATRKPKKAKPKKAKRAKPKKAKRRSARKR